MSETRMTGFRRNELLEDLLAELSIDLQPAENKLITQYQQLETMEYPLILVIGPLRSGTTLFMQWLANTGLFAYPTNLLSRFYQAPIIGAKVQLLLTDPRYNFRNELGEFLEQVEYKSDNGKTRGTLAPNEFWYFWRRFLAEPTRDVWTDDELQQSMDTQTMLAELKGIMDVFQKPFTAKGMLFNYNIHFLDSIFDKVIFVQIKRDPVTNIASILEARKRQLGSETAWYSFKIPEYPQLKDLDPVIQSAGQLYYINKAITQGMSTVAESRKLVIQYEDFCQNPCQIFNQLIAKLGMTITNNTYCGALQFNLTRSAEIKNKTMIEEAFAYFKG